MKPYARTLANPTAATSTIGDETWTLQKLMGTTSEPGASAGGSEAGDAGTGAGGTIGKLGTGGGGIFRGGRLSPARYRRILIISICMG